MLQKTLHPKDPINHIYKNSVLLPERLAPWRLAPSALTRGEILRSVIRSQSVSFCQLHLTFLIFYVQILAHEMRFVNTKISFFCFCATKNIFGGFTQSLPLGEGFVQIEREYRVRLISPRMAIYRCAVCTVCSSPRAKAGSACMLRSSHNTTYIEKDLHAGRSFSMAAE